MANFRVEVGAKAGARDLVGEAVLKEIAEDLGIEGIEKIQVVRVFEISADITEEEALSLCKKLFVDPITEDFVLNKQFVEEFDFAVEVGFHSDVTDNIGLTARRGMEDYLNRKLRENEKVNSKKLFIFFGELDESKIEKIALEKLFNPMIEEKKILKGKSDE